MSRQPFIVSSMLAIAVFALLAAGCSGKSSAPGVASVATSLPSTQQGAVSTQQELVSFTHCMRSHGVSTFPDPDSSGSIPKPEIVAAASAVGRTKFNAAQKACNHLVPSGGIGPQQTAQQRRAQVAYKLSFATCMRSHGISTFPDPTGQGVLSLESVEAQGINLRSPEVQRVLQRCLPVLHAGLTMHDVIEQLAHGGGSGR